MLLALNASKFPWVLDILSTGSHLSLSALLSFYLTRWSITSLLSCVILFFLSSFKNFFSSGSPIDVIITGCCNFPSLVLEFSVCLYFFKSDAGKTGFFLSKSPVRMTPTAFFPCTWWQWMVLQKNHAVSWDLSGRWSWKLRLKLGHKLGNLVFFCVLSHLVLLYTTASWIQCKA